MPTSPVYSLETPDEPGLFWLTATLGSPCTCVASTANILNETPGCAHLKLLKTSAPAEVVPSMSEAEIESLCKTPRLNRPLLSLLLVQPATEATVAAWAKVAERNCLPTAAALVASSAWEYEAVRLGVAKNAAHLFIVKAILARGGAPARIAWGRLREYGVKGREVKLGITEGQAPAWLDQNILAGMLMDEEKEFRVAAIKMAGKLATKKDGILTNHS